MLFCIPIMIECQAEMEWFIVEAKIDEEKQMKERPEFSVETILEGMTN